MITPIAMAKLPKLQTGDKVAILSPSFAAPAVWPHVHELGLRRLREEFGLEPVEFPATRKLDASGEERANDLVAAYTDASIKAVIATLGGDDEVTYIKNLPAAPFMANPKPFFGYSDNTHFANFLWLHGVPSFYGGSLFVQFAEQGAINPMTAEYLRHALFDEGEFALRAGDEYSDMGHRWEDPANLTKRRHYESNSGWAWDTVADGQAAIEGITWGGCLESIDELLRHGIEIPSLAQFEHVVLMTETSEELPPPEYVHRVFRALGERGILQRVRAVLVGRAKAWEWHKQQSPAESVAYRAKQRDITLETVRKYNPAIAVIQNLDFGHTEPQIPLPYGGRVRIDTAAREIYATF